MNAGAIFTLMVLLWLLSLALGDSSIADIAWGPLFVVVVGIGLWAGEGWLPRRLLLFGMVAAWGLRLAFHIGVRNVGKGEDPRYRKWREQHGAAWPLRSLAQVFLLQGAILLVVALPVQLGQGLEGPARWTVWDGLGALVWTAGFAVEIVADAQLRAFVDDPEREGLLTTGLWRYSRHPNYFGEAVLWWGIGLVALSVPWGWATLGGPVLITFLLRYVSGVPLTEERMSRKPGWEEYKRRTPPFVPTLSPEG